MESEADKNDIDRKDSRSMELEINRKDTVETLKLSQIINFLGGEKLHFRSIS